MELRKNRTYKMKIRWLKGTRKLFVTDILFDNHPGVEAVVLGQFQDEQGGFTGIMKKDIHEAQLLEDPA
ncbi:MAG: hypothetical protein JRN22_02200 [Nitrososphaerota archaeon]|nr:hypothetical protein [Nitrososphaerota archaeon]